MKKTLLIALFGISLTGCATMPTFTSSAAPKMTETWSKDIVPVAVGEVNGKQVALYEQHIAVNRESVGVSVPWYKRFWAWLVGLGVLGGALAFFFPTAFFALVFWLLNKYRNLKQAYLDHKAALEETVQAIQDTKAVEALPALKVALNDNQTEKSQLLVAQIRAQS